MTKRISNFILATAITLMITAPAWAESHIYKLYVDGLACPFCAYGVEKTVGGLEGVKSIEIDIDAGIVNVTMKDNAILDKDVAKKAVDDAGFSLRKFTEPDGQS